MNLQSARNAITLLWFFGCGLIYALLAFLSLIDRFSGDVTRVWSWALPTLMPTLLLMAGVYAGAKGGKSVAKELVDPFFLRLTLGVSTFYLLAVLAIIVLSLMLADKDTPLARMEAAQVWLGPLQGLAAGTFGAFYTKSSGTTDVLKDEV